MKKKEKTELRKKTQEELVQSLGDKKLELQKAMTNMKAGKEKNLKKVKLIRREIAQISTIIHEMELMKDLGEIPESGKDESGKGS
ncbi:50S ribosomal protein L29 [Candidatus Woesebacteria bacterium RIFCSPLOWO2_01_FULL_39_61]|uniref:Large ribosomal subunit protein uL29 n=2 Tax=Microgenomates group TaxID=1794810 RepID=A0A0H4T5F7_9BACT|nr:Uncharacterized protein [uncultured Microgenomates bacterium Rifle_16ft_4_minimus_37836]OGM28080.1 MAG: 50S ribosomal protein L29 [Candidatus Woesebacteria bacterium RIFCSPHIGHO2_01_FULL_39_95]OGM34068.1 MAG: 50S ribosomal protein L29 [Candidatus Woesebacteria bacterium RIFCSPHIGHO2_02_FULL_39_13]OGM38327.1 MAG: 50S ribosomal protein L29 [Candidatus Woesebacteria bacterium RIFCSPHIGHO2_12_FULL_40_20]OGM67790.1 MAG: 50S ribosomal protein L29 [Candidatus Woesebacteria bacterium RIFCSPLOWO2_01_